MALFGRGNDVNKDLKDSPTPEDVRRDSQDRLNKTSSTIRLLAGGYLCYLAYDIANNMLTGNTDPATEPVWLMWVSVVLFGVAGAGLVINYFMNYIRENGKSKEDAE